MHPSPRIGRRAGDEGDIIADPFLLRPIHLSPAISACANMRHLYARDSIRTPYLDTGQCVQWARNPGDRGNLRTTECTVVSLNQLGRGIQGSRRRLRGPRGRRGQLSRQFFDRPIILIADRDSQVRRRMDAIRTSEEFASITSLYPGKAGQMAQPRRPDLILFSLRQPGADDGLGRSRGQSGRRFDRMRLTLSDILIHH